MLREKLRPNALPRRLIRYRLGAVLAKLEDLPVFVGTRPRAALAIESRNVVDLQKRLRRPQHAHIANAVEHRVPDRWNPRGFFRCRSHSHIAQHWWILRLQRDWCIRIKLLVRALPAHDHLEQVVFHAVMPVSAPFISVNNASARAVEYLHGRAPPLEIFDCSTADSDSPL